MLGGFRGVRMFRRCKEVSDVKGGFRGVRRFQRCKEVSGGGRSGVQKDDFLP